MNQIRADVLKINNDPKTHLCSCTVTDAHRNTHISSLAGLQRYHYFSLSYMFLFALQPLYPQATHLMPLEI